MNTTLALKRMRDLLVLLADLTALHEELCEYLEARTAAIKRADLRTIGEIDDRIQALAARIAQREGIRRQLVAAMIGGAAPKKRPARIVTVSELASSLAESDRESLLDAALKLRAAVERASRLNRIASLVATTILMHVRCVTAALRSASGESVAYACDGRLVEGKDLKLFEIVG